MTTTETSHQSTLDAEQEGYKQTLGRRHVQMIAIGGAIGTGLFLGSASRLNSTGPALLFSYAFVGVIAYLLMRALGELVLHRATSGAFVSYMREFFGEAAAYVTGWMYWLNWALTGIAELSAVGLYVQYWFPTMPTWATVLIALAVALTINLLSARAFGEFEFWAAVAKVAAIIVFLVVGLVVVVFNMDIGGHEAGFQNLWSNPGGFWPTEDPYSWYGPILVMSGVIFAYAAIEMVAVAARRHAHRGRRPAATASAALPAPPAPQRRPAVRPAHGRPALLDRPQPGRGGGPGDRIDPAADDQRRSLRAGPGMGLDGPSGRRTTVAG